MKLMKLKESKMKKIIIAILTNLILTSCTANDMAKQYGGTVKMDVPCDSKVVTITWKDSQTWILTRPIRKDETFEKYEFGERSRWGVLEGKVILQERECLNK